ncbi:MAG: hypothetical protein WB680_22245 [Candidatus Acidiferrales bacterium]
MKNYGKLTIGLIVVWFLFALFAGAAHLFENNANRIGVAVAIAAAVPLIVFSLWFAASESFRKFTMSLNPRILTSVQVWRIIGFIFVLLEAHSVLPAIFAWPAGYGDMLIGTTAFFAAWQLAVPERRNAFIGWQVLGILDLVTAVSLGTTAGLLDPHGVSMAAMTVLPLSLIPTFLVPLFTILHVICIAQARAWKAGTERSRQFASPLPQRAV